MATTHGCNHTLHALGIDSLRALIQRKADDRHAPEAPKKVLDGSAWTAMGRNTIHILPMSVLVALIAFNYSHYFIGPTFVEDPNDNGYFTAGIQLCAKLEELLCVASLTVILLHALRQQLLGEGVPIGLLGSGIWFTSLAAFCSPDFIGSFSWERPSWRNRGVSWGRVRFYLILVACGLIAATIGPASAVLMLPREQDLPAGGSSYLHYGPNDVYHPDVVTSKGLDICDSPNSTEMAICPSGGYNSLSQTLAAFEYHTYSKQVIGNNTRLDANKQARGAEGNRAWQSFLIQSSNNIIPHVINGLRSRYWSDSATVAIQPHTASVVLMDRLRDQWVNGAEERKGQYQWTYNIRTLGSAVSPFVRVKCTSPRNLFSDASSARFPALRQQAYNEDVTKWGSDQNVSIRGIDRNQSTQLRAQWLPLPIDVFGVADKGFNTTGLLIETPWVDNYRWATGCAVAAAWHNVTVRSERSAAYAAWSVVMSPFDYSDERANCDDSPQNSLTNIPVTLDPSWLRLLTPKLPPSGSAPSMSTLERLMAHGRVPTEVNDTTWFEHITAMVVADGLSRFGSQHVLNATDPDPRNWGAMQVPSYNRTGMLLSSKRGHDDHRNDTTADSATGWFAVFVWGYSYYPSKTSDKLALVPVTAYLLLTTLYILYTVFWISVRGRHGTSSAWDSVTELLVLCQNSPPPGPQSKLDNASAGISHLKTYKTVVKVRAIPSSDGEGPAKLHLVLDDCPGGAATAMRSHRSSLCPLSPEAAYPEVDTIALDDTTPMSSNKSSLTVENSSTPSSTLSLAAMPPTRPRNVVKASGNNGVRVRIDREYG
ncbi:hypothetical protein TI39_contig485g00006 [Zymoseptoria brevis]|uniref:Uncharacterized protein n=1 Tax=Zymoseptoria brevis TaxID=1047168 RepID=A0A0F4GJ95_9PEZI|nr:hypothetical protein TI39_contig485g00006 [Zymoseptoria brevis]